VLESICITSTFFSYQGKKKSPLMLLNWQPVLGRGTTKSQNQAEEKQQAAQGLNMQLGTNN